MSARRDMEDALLSAGLPLMGKVTEELLDTLEGIMYERFTMAFGRLQDDAEDCKCTEGCGDECDNVCTGIIYSYVTDVMVERAMA